MYMSNPQQKKKPYSFYYFYENLLFSKVDPKLDWLVWDLQSVSDIFCIFHKELILPNMGMIIFI